MGPDLQHEPDRYKSYFLKGYFLLISITAPFTIFCALLADEIVLVVLGQKWAETATIFRLRNAICVASGRFFGQTSWQAISDIQPKTPSSSPINS